MSNYGSIYFTLSLILSVLTITGCQKPGNSNNLTSSLIFSSGSAIKVAENNVFTGYTAIAIDKEGEPITFGLTGGEDQEKFSIDADSGLLSFKSAPDFENPKDSNSDNRYLVDITAAAGLKKLVQRLTVTVTVGVLEVKLSAADVKTILFDWVIYDGASYYTLLSASKADSDFSIVRDNITETNISLTLPVHLFDWANTIYRLEAHDENGKLTETPEMSLAPLMISSIGYFKASNTGVNDRFGYALSLSGDGNTAAISAYDNSNATGVSTDGSGETDNSAAGSGAVYVFSRKDGVWSQDAFVKASNSGAGDKFGGTLSLSEDGNTMAVGAAFEDSSVTGINPSIDDSTSNAALDSGAVYVFNRNSGVWTQQAYIKASNNEAGDNFGISVSLAADGLTLVVGSSAEDSNATGVLLDSIDKSDNSAENSGAAYVFVLTKETWSQQAFIKANNTGVMDQFGTAVSIAADGNTLAIGASLEDSKTSGVIKSNVSSDANSENKNNEEPSETVIDDNSALEAGAVYVFVRNDSSWRQQAYIKASNAEASDVFGFSVSLSADGNTLAIGSHAESSDATGVSSDGSGESSNLAPESGAVYVFERINSDWSQQGYIKASNSATSDLFGYAISLAADGNSLAVGAYQEDSNGAGINEDVEADNSAADSGAVYLFTRKGTVWRQKSYVKASNSEANDIFGTAVNLSKDGNTLVVGASFEGSNATGINNEGDGKVEDSALEFGAVYFY